MSRLLRALAVLAVSGFAIVIPHTPVFAGQSIDPSTLNPPAPAPYTCTADGSGAICRREIPPAPYGPSDNQIFCGSGANAFDTYDSGIESETAVRYYDSNLNLVRRVIHFDDDGQWSNAVTGAFVPYEQHNVTTDVLAVPGDLNSITETITGNNTFTLPHMGQVALDNGRVTTAPDGTIEFESAQHDILDYIFGDPGALQQLCVALGAP